MADGNTIPNKAPAAQDASSSEETLLLPAPPLMSNELDGQPTTPVRSRHNNIDSIHIMPNSIDNSGSSVTPSLITTHRFLSAAVARAMIDKLPKSKKHTLIPSLIPVLPPNRKLEVLTSSSSSSGDDDDDDDDTFFDESTLLDSTGTTTLTSIPPTPNKNKKNGGKGKGKGKAKDEMINNGDEWYEADDEIKDDESNETEDDWSQLSASISEISLTGAPLDDDHNAANTTAADATADAAGQNKKKRKNVARRLWGATKKLVRRNPGGHRLGGGGGGGDGMLGRANPLGLAGGGFDLAIGALGKLPYLKDNGWGGGTGG